MKNLTLSICMLVALTPVYAQTGGKPLKSFPTDNRSLTGDEWRLQLVAQLLALPSPVTNGAAQLHGMGDEAAVDVMKVLSAKPEVTAAESKAALDVVHMAFEKPESIIEPVNRKPHATLFLLQRLSTASGDDTTRQRISQEVTSLRSRFMPPVAERQ